MATKHVGMRSADQISTMRNPCFRSLTGRNGSVKKGNVLKGATQRPTRERAALKCQSASWGLQDGRLVPLSGLHSEQDLTDKCSLPILLCRNTHSIHMAPSGLFFSLSHLPFKNFLTVYNLK